MMILLLSAFAFAANTCPVGKLKECQTYLKTQLAKKNDQAFMEKYDQVCAENKDFSCIKVTVRDDVNLVMKDQVQLRGPNADFYSVKVGGEDFIYILMPKAK